MNTDELRGLILKGFYDLRGNGRKVQAMELFDLAPNNVQDILNVCGYLGEEGLIEWEPHYSTRSGAIDEGLGRIKSKGVRTIEGTLAPPEGMTVTNNSINYAGPVHVHGQSTAIETSSLPRIRSAIFTRRSTIPRRRSNRKRKQKPSSKSS
jgi:hypothetical protein